MAFTTPDYEAIKAAILRDIANQSPEALTGTDSDFGVRAAAVAAAIEGLYQHQIWTANQVFPDTADSDYLERHAALRGLARKKATASTGSIRFSGTVGAAVAVGTEAKTSGGLLFVTTAAGVVGADGTVEIPARSAEGGADTNVATDTAVTLMAAPSGVLSQAVIVSMLGGTDAETDAGLLDRLLDVLRDPPSGGNAGDYKRWAKSVDGVTQAWVYPLRRGLGTVDVAVSSSGGLPSPELLAAVQSSIDAVRPVSVKEFLAVSPTPVVVDVTAQIRISGVTLDQAQSAVETALATYFSDLEPGDTVYRSQLEAIITGVSGIVDRDLESPAANVETTTTLPGGIEWPRLGTVTLTLME